MTRAVFTCGDINGISPEISVKTFTRIFSKHNNNQIIFICPVNIFQDYYKLTKAGFMYRICSPDADYSSEGLNVIPLPDAGIDYGKPTRISGRTAFLSLQIALELISKNKADILITSPVSKEALSKSGFKFPGHTEYLADSENSRRYLMVFLSGNLNAALMTIHEPLSRVAGILSKKKIIEAVMLLDRTARQDLAIKSPKIAVLGFNPHSGENGLIGKEEIKIISPAIKFLKSGYDVEGPFVPDAFWGNKTYKKYDIVLGMYHDQVLIPYKLLNFNTGVNFTAGLNLIRTSPDHGTAYDIAGRNLADPSSLLQAYKYALKIFRNRKKFLASSESK